MDKKSKQLVLDTIKKLKESQKLLERLIDEPERDMALLFGDKRRVVRGQRKGNERKNSADIIFKERQHSPQKRVKRKIDASFETPSTSTGKRSTKMSASFETPASSDRPLDSETSMEKLAASLKCVMTFQDMEISPEAKNNQQ